MASPAKRGFLNRAKIVLVAKRPHWQLSAIAQRDEE